jgi:hypothetical protein
MSGVCSHARGHCPYLKCRTQGGKGNEGGREGLGFAAAAVVVVVIGTVRGACSFSRKKERLGSISYLGYSINLLILLLSVRALPCLA